MARAPLLPLLLALLPGTGCEIFLPDDWGTLGSPCHEDSHCRGGLWCYEGSCVGDSAECNNGIVEEGELCDGGAAGVSCEDLGLGEGNQGYVSCTNCSYDTSRCGAPIGACTPGASSCAFPETCVGFLTDIGDGFSAYYRCAKACASEADCGPGLTCTLTLPDSEPGLGWACLPETITRSYGRRCLVDNECEHGLECIVMKAVAPSRTACAEECNFNVAGSTGCDEFMPPGMCIDNGVRDFCGVEEWVQ